MYLGEEYVNNPKLSDVTFLVEGGVSAVKFSPVINFVYFLCSLVSIYDLMYFVFLSSGKSFYAHRDCLVSSDIFRAMFDGSYRVSIN